MASQVFDNRSDGCITVENFKQMMGTVGEKLTAQEVTQNHTCAVQRISFCLPPLSLWAPRWSPP